jgi:hypothetical protein
MAATATKKSRKAAPARAAKRTKKFDSENSDHWHAIPSKGMLFALAIAVFNGAKVDGACFGNRELAKAAIAEAKEKGIIE